MTAYDNTILADSPLAYWKLSETSGTTAADSSGNGHSGTYTNSPTLGQSGLLSQDAAAGEKCVLFNGTNNYIQIAAGSWQNAATYTGEAWIKPTVDQAGMIMQSYTPEKRFMFYSAISGIALIYTDVGATEYSLAIGRGVLSLNTIYHLAFTHDGINLQYYVNGVLMGMRPAAGNLNTTSSTPLILGGTSSYLAGYMEKVAIYGTALSATRIMAHYTAGIPSTPAQGTWGASF